MANGTVTTHEIPTTSSFSHPFARVWRHEAWSGAACALILLGLIYYANLSHFVYTWWTDENYSHGFLVPLLSLYFAREAARRGTWQVRGGVVLGISLLVISILARLATILVPVGIVGDVGFILGIAGICSLLAGSRALNRFGFSIAFLIFMVPLPVALYTTLASPLQRMVSQAGAGILNSLGIPVLCEGNLMTLPGDVHMFVAEACSGMRQLTGFLALTTAVAYLSNRQAWYKLVLVVSAIPIAMAANVLRVTITGVIMYRFGSQYATGAFHLVEGIAMMGVGLGLLGIECAILKLIASGPAPAAQPAVALP